MPRYKIGAAIWGSIGCAVLGFLLLLVILLVASIAYGARGYEVVTGLWPLPVLICAAIPWVYQAIRLSAEKKAVRRRAEDQKRAAAKTRADARDEAVLDAERACQEAVKLWSLLPEDLENAVSWIPAAQQHFRAGAFSPFWESIEHGYQCLGAYRVRLERIRHLSARYADAQQRYWENDGDEPVLPFPLDASNLAPSRTAISVARVLDQAVYEAQKVPVYAQIWEQRRNTAAVIEGFQTLSDAVSQMKNALSAQIGALENTLAQTTSSMQTELRVSNEHLAKVAAISSQQTAQAVLLNTQVANAGFRLKRIEKEIVGS